MQWRCSLTRLILTGAVALVLTPLMVCVEAQARIAFASDRDGNYEIYVMDADGGNPQNLTNNPDTDHSPSWSPDGKRIAFVSDRDGHAHVRHGRLTYEIYLMDADGNNQRRLTNNGFHDENPSWSPEGKHIVFSSDRDNDRGHNSEIYMMSADGTNQRRLTNNLTDDEDPAWSPDGKRIAFEADRKGDFVSWDIYVMDADGGNQQKLTNRRGWDWNPSWSPDSERITFMSERDGDGNSEIYVMDANGGNPQNLTNNPHPDVNPAWFNSPFSVSPVGKQFTTWGWVKQADR